MQRSITSGFRRTAVVAIALVAVTAAPAQAASPTPDAWQFEVTPYLFGSALSGTTGMSAVSADVDMSFGDILENLDSGFMAMVEARKGPWGFGFDGIYFKLPVE